MEKVTSNIRHLRKHAGYTQAQLAEKLEIKRSLVGAYEEGRAEPKLSTLVNVARLFEVSLDELITTDLSDPNYKPEVGQPGGGKLRVLAITVDQDDRENIELVPYKASAGYLNGYADPEFMEELPKFRLPMLQSPGTYRAFEIKGDSEKAEDKVDPILAATRLTNDLIASPGHKANILNANFTHVGIGSWRTAPGQTWSGGGYALTNVFVAAQVFGRMSTTATTTPTPAAWRRCGSAASWVSVGSRTASSGSPT